MGMSLMGRMRRGDEHGRGAEASVFWLWKGPVDRWEWGKERGVDERCVCYIFNGRPSMFLSVLYVSLDPVDRLRYLPYRC